MEQDLLAAHLAQASVFALLEVARVFDPSARQSLHTHATHVYAGAAFLCLLPDLILTDLGFSDGFLHRAIQRVNFRTCLDSREFFDLPFRISCHMVGLLSDVLEEL